MPFESQSKMTRVMRDMRGISIRTSKEIEANMSNVHLDMKGNSAATSTMCKNFHHDVFKSVNFLLLSFHRSTMFGYLHVELRTRVTPVLEHPEKGIGTTHTRGLTT
jgi:hypothetical protein